MKAHFQFVPPSAPSKASDDYGLQLTGTVFLFGSVQSGPRLVVAFGTEMNATGPAFMHAP